MIQKASLWIIVNAVLKNTIVDFKKEFGHHNQYNRLIIFVPIKVSILFEWQSKVPLPQLSNISLPHFCLYNFYVLLNMHEVFVTGC
jgi:hypothetical protein